MRTLIDKGEKVMKQTKKSSGKAINKKFLTSIVLGIIVGLAAAIPSFAQGMNEENCFYLKSLHATARGMAYWYDKANGGLESITGIPYSQTGCAECHISSCDTCHKQTVKGKAYYSIKEAKNQKKCLSCHSREAFMIMKIDKEANTTDVHVAKGMTCMDCHTSREIHGDGTVYKSMKEPGAMDVKCERCHDSLPKSVPHTIHGNKLSCNACHVRHIASCNSCHFETWLKDKKKVSLPVSGWKFLMNYNGKVTSAMMQTIVAPGNKTFMIFAPQFSHSVMKRGSKCEECHATKIDKQIVNGGIDLSWLDKGKEQNLKGVVPVVKGVRYNCVYQNYHDGTWTPIADPIGPETQYVGYGSPLTQEQLKKLLTPQKARK